MVAITNAVTSYHLSQTFSQRQIFLFQHHLSWLPDAMQRLEVFIICYAVFSCCCSIAVIGTLLFFRKMQRGNFLPTILYMSMCDLGLNITSAFGFPESGTPLCWFQGIFSTFFTISGWFWTTMLAYRVYCMVRYGGCKVDKQRMHAICWGLPLLLTVIPLSTTDYGSSPNSNQWCLFKDRKHVPRFWTPFWSYTTFFIWLVICVALMLAWQITISYKFRDSSMREVIRRTYDKVYLYPVVMILCWGLNLICDDFDSGKPFLNALSMIFAISDGILSALIFMVKSEEAQRRWYRYFFPPQENAFNDIVEPRLDFELDGEDVELTDYGTPSFATKFSESTAAGDRSSSTANPVHMSEMSMTTNPAFAHEL
jgi:hypothetical protein